MARLRDHRHPIGRVRLLALLAVLGIAGAYVAMVVQSPPASAEVKCGPGKKPVFDPTTGTIVCRGSTGGRDPGPGPGPEPPDGTKQTFQKKTVCSEQKCPRDVWCTGKDQPMVYWERTMVYHRGVGWEPVPGPAGQWHRTGLTNCEPPNDPKPTAQQVWDALNNFGLPGVKPSVEPPNGRTLVNFPTIFYVHAETQQIDLPVGPVTVQIRATPTSYCWNFGDGATSTTTSPGHPYPGQDVTHEYARPGAVRPSVTVMYRVEWQYDGSGWQAFPQQMQAKNSPPSPLEVVQSVTELGSG